MSLRPDRQFSGLLAALAALVLLNVMVTPNFLNMQTLAVNVSQVATIAIVALGMTLVIASGGIDLSVGSTMAVAGALAPIIFLSDWAVGLPDGLSTLVGRDGSAMSGGQRQRLALARVLLADHRIVVLDEPTAHLDAGTATAVMGDLLDALDDRTVVVLGHDDPRSRSVVRGAPERVLLVQQDRR